MSTRAETVTYIVDQLHTAGDIRSRAMFGEYALYCNDKVVAFICDDSLFVKVTEGATQFLDDSHLAPAYPGSKNYLQVPPEQLEDSEWLTQFIRHTAGNLPVPKPKKA